MNGARKITDTDYYNNVPYACPREARLLQVWSSVSTFDDYVDSLTPSGNTYHDIGLLWGARLMSPTGIFASDNAFTQNGGQRSEERRVGKECVSKCRSRWSQSHYKTNTHNNAIPVAPTIDQQIS